MAFQECHSITFAGMGRVRDGVLLATWNNSNYNAAIGDPRLKTVEKLIGAIYKKNMQPGQRQKLSWDKNDVFFVLDFPEGAYLYMCIIPKDMEYPQRLAYAFLTEIMNFVYDFVEQRQINNNLDDETWDSLSHVLANPITELAIKYDDPIEVDKIERLKGKTDAIKDLMKENVHHMLANLENLDTLQEDAKAMQDEAQEYSEKAEEVKDYFWWKDCKLTLIIIGIVIVIVGVAVLLLFKPCNSSGKPAETSGGSQAAAPEPATASNGTKVAASMLQLMFS